MIWQDLIEVRNSDISGKGVFAKVRIPRGIRVMQYIGYALTEEQGEASFDDAISRGVCFYEMYLLRGWYIEGSPEWNPAGRVNHSCSPNLEIRYVRKPWDYQTREGFRKTLPRQVWMVALRDIEQGEEFLCDYGVGFDPSYTFKLPCRCGSPSCRGFIVAEEDYESLVRYQRELKGGT